MLSQWKLPSPPLLLRAPSPPLEPCHDDIQEKNSENAKPCEPDAHVHWDTLQWVVLEMSIKPEVF